MIPANKWSFYFYNETKQQKMKNKFKLTVFLVLAVVTSTSAQSLHLCLIGSANISYFRGSNANFKSDNINSYHAGFFVELGVSEIFSIQPELMYSTMGAKLSVSGSVDEFRNKLGYLSIPVLAKVYLLSDRLSIELGPQVSFLLREKDNVNLRKSNTYDFSIAGGATLQILGPLFIQGRYNLGLSTVKHNVVNA